LEYDSYSCLLIPFPLICFIRVKFSLVAKYDPVLLTQAGNLQYASPATVSRAGVVYVEPRNLGYKPYWDRWLRSRTGDEEKGQLEDLFVQYVDPQIKHIIDGQMGLMQALPLKTIIPQTGLNMVCKVCVLSML
jgi:dynein heavy chain